jgi:hypothetical protein
MRAVGAMGARAGDGPDTPGSVTGRLGTTGAGCGADWAGSTSASSPGGADGVGVSVGVTRSAGVSRSAEAVGAGTARSVADVRSVAGAGRGDDAV